MKFNIPKDWILKMAKLEEGHEIGAGIPPFIPHITCPVCWLTSYNAGDIHNGYCAHCHAFTAPPAMFGEPIPDEPAKLLGTGFWRFCSPIGIDGLMKWTPEIKRLDLLGVFATKPGTGQFRHFIDCAKVVSHTICVWQIWNPFLKVVLERYHFQYNSERLPIVSQPAGELNHGMRWDCQG